MQPPFDNDKKTDEVDVGEELSRHCDLLRQRYLRRTGDRWLAEDLAQETALTVLARLDREALDEPHKLGAYIHQTAKFLHIAHMRREARRRTEAAGDLDLFEGTGNDGERLALAAERRAQLEDLLNALAAQRDREILRRTLLDGEAKPNICEALELDIEHFDRVLSRAKKRLLGVAAQQGESST